MRWRRHEVGRGQVGLIVVMILVCGARARGDGALDPQSATPAPIQSPARIPQPIVSLSLADPSPIIGVTAQTKLRIEMTDAPESPMPMPRVLCSVGQVEDLERTGPTTFTARYIPPPVDFLSPPSSLPSLTIHHGRFAE